MGFTLVLDTRPELEIEQDWTSSDGKEFIDVVSLSIELLEKHLKVDLSPLKKLAGDEPSEEDIEEMAEMAGISKQEILKDLESTKDAWQTPADLAACLRTLIQAIGEQGKSLPLGKMKKLHPNRSYFEKSFFLAWIPMLPLVNSLS